MYSRKLKGLAVHVALITGDRPEAIRQIMVNRHLRTVKPKENKAEVYMVLEPMPRKTTGTNRKFESLDAFIRNNTQHLGPFGGGGRWA